MLVEEAAGGVAGCAAVLQDAPLRVSETRTAALPPVPEEVEVLAGMLDELPRLASERRVAELPAPPSPPTPSEEAPWSTQTVAPHDAVADGLPSATALGLELSGFNSRRTYSAYCVLRVQFAGPSSLRVGDRDFRVPCNGFLAS